MNFLHSCARCLSNLTASLHSPLHPHDSHVISCQLLLLQPPFDCTPHTLPGRCPQVPYRLLKSFHKIQQRLVRELEKKFSGKDVVLIANRRILRPTTSGRSNDRPRSRTLTAVRGPPSPSGVVYWQLCGVIG